MTNRAPDPVYDMTRVRAPRTAGFTLRLATALVESALTGPLLTRKLFADTGISALRRVACDDALSYDHPAVVPAPPTADAGHELTTEAPLPETHGRGFRYPSTGDFLAAYRTGSTTPRDVAERVLAASDAVDRADPPLRALLSVDRDDVVRQAEASTLRWREGRPLGPFDGVPVSVKDELDQRGYRTTVGTRFLGTAPATADAEVVRRLRDAGALLFGKNNMHEIGIGVTGINPHHGAARNPYAPNHVTGGSSSGSAAAVAAGLGPVSVGADGGGSIRIPAGLCGVVGLKGTFGRFSEHGASPLCWTVAHVGPIGATVHDVAAAYLVMAGRDPHDPGTRHQPTPVRPDLARASLAGLRVGVFPAWFEDADPEVVAAARAGVAHLVAAGATLVEVSIPELGRARAVQLVTIVSEMATAHLAHYIEHRTDYGLDTRVNLALARRLLATDYVHAQRVRRRIGTHFVRAFSACDVLATPTTAGTAMPILPDALATGESNLENVERMMRFVLHGNVTGLPALSVPCGYDRAGLPIGLQLMGPAWSESTLLELGALVERSTERRQPPVFHRVLG